MALSMLLGTFFSKSYWKREVTPSRARKNVLAFCLEDFGTSLSWSAVVYLSRVKKDKYGKLDIRSVGRFK